MEFFDWISVPQLVLTFLQSTKANSVGEAVEQLKLVWIICLASAGALYHVGVLFGGLGLMRMAKSKCISYWWIGFLPFGNTVLAGKLAGEANMFGVKMKQPGIWAVIAEVFFVLVEVGLLVTTFLFLNEEFYDIVEAGEELSYIEFKPNLVKLKAPEYAWLLTLNTVLQVLDIFARVTLLFLFLVMFTAFFRKYYLRGPFLMAFLCSFLPVRGFVLFAVRNNTPVDYNAYMRRRMEEIQRRQQQMYGSGAGGYRDPADPFSEFGGGNNGNGADGGNAAGGSGGSDDNPFSDF